MACKGNTYIQGMPREHIQGMQGGHNQGLPVMTNEHIIPQGHKHSPIGIPSYSGEEAMLIACIVGSDNDIAPRVQIWDKVLGVPVDREV